MDGLPRQAACYTISNDDALSSVGMFATLPRRAQLYSPIGDPAGTPRRDSNVMGFNMNPGGTLPRGSVASGFVSSPSHSKATLQSLATLANRYLNVSHRHSNSNYPILDKQMDYLRAIERNDIEEVKDILRRFVIKSDPPSCSDEDSDSESPGTSQRRANGGAKGKRPPLLVEGELPQIEETEIIGKRTKVKKSSRDEVFEFKDMRGCCETSQIEIEKGANGKPPKIRRIKPSPKISAPTSPTKKNIQVFDKNCRDQWGRTGLFIAVSRRNIEMIELLMEYAVDLGECLYHAIDFGYYDVIELLLKYDELRDQVITGDDSFYPPGLTPIQLAAHKNDFIMLKLLHNHGFRIMGEREKGIAKKRVFSKKMKSNDSFDADSPNYFLLEKAWNMSNDRMLYYRALSSPAYLIMMHTEGGFDDEPQDNDFLDRIFRLYEKLKKKARREPDARSMYLQLAEQVENFACDLLNEVRSAGDLSNFLRFDPPGHERTTLQKNHLLPLQTACEVHMKNFVAHQHCQLALSILRMGTLFDSDGAWKTLLIRFLLAILFPFLSLAFIIAPDSKLGALLRNPMVNFSCHMVSEITFLLLMVIRLFLMWGMKCDCLGTPPNGLEIVIMLWIFARTVNELKKLRQVKLVNLLSNVWKLNDYATLTMFYIVFALRASDIGRFHGQFPINPADDWCEHVSSNSTLCDRSMWTPDEYWPLLVSEGCMSFIYILIFIRAMEMMYIDRTFGPLQLSLDKMLLDVLRFGISFFIFTFFAFACGMTQLYWAYGTPRQYRNVAGNGKIVNYTVCQEDITDEEKKSCYPVYASISDSMLEQFWTIFGYGYTTEPPQSLTTPDTDIRLTYYIGLVLSGLFHCWAVVVMLNMLIAMMSHSFDRVRDNAEVEWKFHRSNTWMKYMRKGVYPRPPPMNVIPSPRDISSIYYSIKSLIQRCRGKNHYSNSKRRGAHRSELQDNGTESARYRQAINRVTNRYLRKHLLEEFQHDEENLLLQQVPSKSNSPRKLSAVR